MKPILRQSTKWWRATLLSLSVAATAACAADADVDTAPAEADENVGAGEAEMLGMGLAITQQSLVFDACAATLTLRVRTLDAGLGFLAVDATGAEDLALELLAPGADGALAPSPVLSPTLIDGALLAQVRASLAAASAAAGIVVTTSVLTDAQIALLAAQLDASARLGLLRLVGITDASLEATLLGASIRLALDPAITASTLLFGNLVAFRRASTVVLRASFVGQALTMARFSVLAGSAAGRLGSAVFAVPFTSAACVGPLPGAALLPPIILPPIILPPIILPPIILPPIILPPFPPIGACGDNLCRQGEFCCNPSCGICAPLGGACIQVVCD
jgi:hypothetical protein